MVPDWMIMQRRWQSTTPSPPIRRTWQRPYAMGSWADNALAGVQIAAGRWGEAHERIEQALNLARRLGDRQAVLVAGASMLQMSANRRSAARYWPGELALAIENADRLLTDAKVV